MLDKKIIYLIVGIWNTVFGYLIGVATYYLLFDTCGVLVVGIVSNIVSITMSFVTYKLIVFRTIGSWVKEYIKCYLVYGGMAVIGIGILWFFIQVIGLNIWVAQAFTMCATVAISYLAHDKFTFKKSQTSP